MISVISAKTQCQLVSFIFGGRGAGVACGFVIHAQEIEADNSPICELYHEGCGNFRLSETTQNAFEFLSA